MRDSIADGSGLHIASVIDERAAAVPRGTPAL